MHSFSEMTLDTAAIREMITASFDDEEFTVFCYDYFRDVYEQFSSGTKRLVKIHLLIDYCDRRGQMRKLLDLVQENNPYQYEQYLSRIYRSSKIPPSANAKHRDNISLWISDVRLDDLTPEQIKGLTLGIKVTLASVLGLDVEDVQIMGMRPGSVIVEVNLPSEAVNRLLSLDSSFLISELGIEKASKNSNLLWPKMIFEEQASLWTKLSPEEQASLFAGLSPEEQIGLFSRLSSKKQALLWVALSLNRQTKLWSRLSPVMRNRLWAKLSRERRASLWAVISSEEQSSLWLRLSPKEQTSLFASLPPEELINLSTKLAPQKLAALWSTLSLKVQDSLWTKLSSGEQAHLLPNLFPADKARLWTRLSPERQASLWARLSPEDQISLWAILPFNEDTGASVLTKRELAGGSTGPFAIPSLEKMARSLAKLTLEKRTRLMTSLPPEGQTRLRELMKRS